jgi:hypothetical protein
MQTDAVSFSGKSWALWFVGTAIGWVSGFLPAMVTITGAFCCGGDVVNWSEVISRICMYAGLIFLGAFIVAAGQANALEPSLGRLKSGWLWSTSIVAFVAWILGWAASIPVSSSGSADEVGWWIRSGAVVGAVVGLLVGITQAIILKRAKVAGLWWIGASVLGWTCASVTYWLVYYGAGGPFETIYTNYPGTPWAESASAPGALSAMLLAWIAGGLVLAAITGFAMILLLGNKRYRSEI